MREGTREANLEAEATSFRSIENKWAVAIAPSVDMQMRPHGQEEPSSSLWFGALRASTDVQCTYSILGEYRTSEIRGANSLADLETSIRTWLPDAMRVSRLTSSRMPTSLCLIVHGIVGQVVMGGHPTPVLDLLERIVSWLPEEDRPWLHHVHLDSCKALTGIQTHEKQQRASIRHITLTGFSVNTEVASAQIVGQRFLRRVSNVIETTDAAAWQQHGLTAEILQRAKQLLQDGIGAPPRGGPSNPDAIVSDERALVADLQIR